jgi:hypothetical protein
MRSGQLQHMSTVQEFVGDSGQLSALLGYITRQRQRRPSKAKPALTISIKRTVSAGTTDRDLSPVTALIHNTKAPRKAARDVVQSTFKKAYEESQVLSSLRKLAIAKTGDPKEGRLILDKLLKIRPDRPTNTVKTTCTEHTEQLLSSNRLASQRSSRRSPRLQPSCRFSTSLQTLFKKSGRTSLGSTQFRVIRLPSSPTRVYFRVSS